MKGIKEPVDDDPVENENIRLESLRRNPPDMASSGVRVDLSLAF